MKVLYDYQVFASQKVGGISRYFFELINSSQTIFSPHLAIKFHRNLYLQQVVESLPYPRKNSILDFGENSFPGRGILYKIKERCFPSKDPIILNQKYVRDQLSQVNPDIFHPTYYNDYFLDYLQRTPFVLTIYDMIHEFFPEHFANDKTQILKEILFHRANQVIAISETTKNDIMDIYNVSGEKISVVHLAESLTHLDDTSQDLMKKLPKRYLLYVGERGKYKNFNLFVTAISKLLRNDDDLQLICTGVPFYKSETDLFDLLSISHKILHYFVSDAELKCLYRNAEAFIFPSLYEGFGIPVLEAFACDCPVLLSLSGALPEIGGEAAIYFNSKSALEIENAVQKVIYNPELRQSLIQKGKERLKQFSWADTVMKTADVYRKCASN